ncbi:hypothetical protein C474_19624 [Halogeometricum pallidum JCM 14848]|uniref:Uncharacterized protein n=1 Tax=Halogeometricum pallidum JCM 14848 TaxID=1227487 RepID=M0CT46_HALPD|nr:hypothetical protein C474_19624 [Halogeometricum pallidum JCM 14848]
MRFENARSYGIDRSVFLISLLEILSSFSIRRVVIYRLCTVVPRLPVELVILADAESRIIPFFGEEFDGPSYITTSTQRGGAL